jgi:hypothetical protein
MEPEPTALPFAAEQDEIRALYTIYVSLCSLSPRGPRPDPRATLRIAVRATHRGDSWFLDKENARTAEIVGGWYGGASGRESWRQHGPTDTAAVAALLRDCRGLVSDVFASAERDAAALDTAVRDATERLRVAAETIAAAKLSMAQLGEASDAE